MIVLGGLSMLEEDGMIHLGHFSFIITKVGEKNPIKVTERKI